jgi:hypothetical protein
MAGFTVPRDIYKLEFDGEQYAGIVVRVRAASFGTLLHIDDLFQPGESSEYADTRKKVDELHQMFVDHLVDWNLEEEDGRPVPVTVEGLRSQQGPFTNAIITAWRTTPVEVPVPLERPSSDGELLEELRIPMESPSASLAS